MTHSHCKHEVKTNFIIHCKHEVKTNVMINLIEALHRIIIPPLPEGGGGYTVLPLSVLPSSKIFFVTFCSVTVDGRNLIFGHKHHIGIPYCG